MFNKQDKVEGEQILRDFKADKIINASAKTGEGLEDLKNALEEILRNQKIYVEKCYPYDQAGKIQIIRKYGQLISEDYTEAGIEVKAYVPVEVYDRVM